MAWTAERRGVPIGGRTVRERYAPGSVEDERSIGQIVSDLASHTQELMRGEFALAKQEATTSAKQLGGAAAIGAAAWPFALATVILLGFAAAAGLDEALPAWASYLIVAAVFGAIAAAFALVARNRIQHAQIAPSGAINQTKEDLTWIKEHKA
ncbi:MAG: hypothetical protein JWM90_2414 [Thermoleophilia bacterium]|nr:hypothetical protein [Thermoleophilia bacterium]